jgi:hypothetical protein
MVPELCSRRDDKGSVVAPIELSREGLKKSYTSTPSLAHRVTCSPAADLEQIRAHKGAERWRFPATKFSELGSIRPAALGTSISASAFVTLLAPAILGGSAGSSDSK